MKTTDFRICLGALAAGLLLLGSVAQAQGLPHMAQARLNVPVESPGIPAYMRLEAIGEGWRGPRNADWTALIFYRDPACIPAGFDLTDFFDFPGPNGLGAFGCPLLVEGFDLRFETLDPTEPPDYIFLRNRTQELPVWFVSTDELEVLLERGYLFIDELEALPSRIMARAWKFEEQLHPSGGAIARPGLTISALGRLETGGRFSLLWHYQPAAGEDVFDLDMELPQPPPPPAPGGPPNVLCVIHPHLPACRG